MRLVVLVAAASWTCGCGSSGAQALPAGHEGGGESAVDAASARDDDVESASTSASAQGGSSADTLGGSGGGDGGMLDSTADRADGTMADAGAPDGAVIGDGVGVAAARDLDFLASIGVCAHVAQGVDDPQQAATAIGYTGIRNLRDDGNPAAVPNWISMHQQVGLRVCMLPKNGDVATTVTMAKQLQAAGALLAVEGPNEPNNWPVTYLGQTSGTSTFLPIAQFQRDLYAAVHGDPALSGIPVFASSEAGGSEPDNVGLQFLTIPDDAGTTMPAGTKYADYANTHNYVSGHSGNLVENVCYSAEDPTLNGDWDGLYVEYGRTWNKGFAGYSNGELVALPRVTTETGWATSGNGAITPEQQARLFLNLYLEAFKRGWTYTFVYMLRDDPSQGYWGLFDTAYQPKTSGTYLHNLTTILADTGSRAPGLLNYSIANQPPTVHDLLLQKSDGTFELAVWDERPAGGTDNVVVSLSNARALVKVYDPTTGTSPTQTLSNVSSVSLALSDHPVILEI